MLMNYYCELEDHELRYAKDGDAGLDLPITEKVVLEPGQREKIKTGVHVEIPEGHFGLLDTRSSTGGGLGIDLMCRTIDQGYRGNIRVAVINHSDETLTFEPGERLAQLLVLPVAQVKLNRVENPDKLSESERGDTGFGSTGKKNYVGGKN